MSSIEEFSHFMSKDAKFSRFDPKTDCDAPYQYDTVQDCYRLTESFEETFK
jgi:phenylalanine-4-hydroxylase